MKARTLLPRDFDPETAANVYKDGVYGKIWKLVVAVVLWSTWLARNELLFSNNRMEHKTLEFLIFTRVNKWGNASGILSFYSEPIWEVNPQGTIAIYHHKVMLEYWDLKLNAYDYVCGVDGSWGINNSKMFG